jgi:hypothetical protein
MVKKTTITVNNVFVRKGIVESPLVFFWLINMSVLQIDI